ncbi:MAG: UpxY family transcription antiterminator [Acidobacteriaceae bacterium]
MVSPQWFAAYTYPRHEKKVAEYLGWAGIESFLPLYKEAHTWNNGLHVTVEKPLFPSYIFVRVEPSDTTKILRTPSIASLVTVAGVPAPLPSAEIESLRAGVSRLRLEPHPYLKQGDRVRVKSGPFADLEGVLVLHKNRWRVVISIDLLMQAVSVEIDSSALERLPRRITHCA